MRRTEVLSLPLNAVNGFDLADRGPDQAVLITVLNTKGRRPRRVWVPIDVLRETQAYIDQERARVMKDRTDHGLVFVNPVRSAAHAGKPVRPDTATAWFREAIVAAELARRFVDPNRVGFSVNRFVLHDLRHTSAVWMYVALREAGVQRPWKIVQARLGHLRLETTEKIYLAHIDEDESDISDILKSYHDRWVRA